MLENTVNHVEEVLHILPRGRAKSMEARIRAWPKLDSEEPKLLAHCGFKAGCVQIVSIDDREKHQMQENN